MRGARGLITRGLLRGRATNGRAPTGQAVGTASDPAQEPPAGNQPTVLAGGRAPQQLTKGPLTKTWTGCWSSWVNSLPDAVELTSLHG